MKSLSTSVGMFVLQSRTNTQRLLQYRTDFSVGVFIALCYSLLGPLFQYLLFTRSNGYPGWTWDQILVMQAMLLLASGLRDMFFGDAFQRIQDLTAKGELDQLLLKPFPPLLTLLTGSFSVFSLPTVLVGAGAVAWASTRSGHPPGLTDVAMFLAFLAASMALYLTESVVFCTLTVRWTYPLRLRQTLEKVIRFGDPPLQVYPVAIRTLFLTVAPLSVAAYWPAQSLLGRLAPTAWVALGSAFAMLAIALWAWNRQIERYSSAGG